MNWEFSKEYILKINKVNILNQCCSRFLINFTTFKSNTIPHLLPIHPTGYTDNSVKEKQNRLSTA